MSALMRGLWSRLLRRTTEEHPLALCECFHLRIDHRPLANGKPGRCEGTRAVGVDYDYTGRPQRHESRPCTCLIYVDSGRWDRGGIALAQRRARERQRP